MSSANDAPETEELLLGYRHAGLVAGLDSSGDIVEIGFSALNEPNIFGVNATAVCRTNLTHTPPHDNHSCGFYSLKDSVPILSGRYSGMVARPYNVLLEVLPYGEILEGAKGMRSAAQAVREVTFADTCQLGSISDSNCAAKATHFILHPEAVNITPNRRWTPLIPACVSCAPPERHRVLSFVDAEQLLGVPLLAGSVIDPAAAVFNHQESASNAALGFLSSAAGLAGGLFSIFAFGLPASSLLFLLLPLLVAFVTLSSVFYVFAQPSTLRLRLFSWAPWLVPTGAGLAFALNNPSFGGGVLAFISWLVLSVLLGMFQAAPTSVPSWRVRGATIFSSLALFLALPYLASRLLL